MLPFLGRLATPFLRGAGALTRGGAFGAGATMGARMLTPDNPANNNRNANNVIPFNSMAKANLASNNPGAVTDNASAGVSQRAEVSNNNGRNTTVNANVLESSTDTLQDIENVLVDIKDELKDINKNTEPKEVFKTQEKTEEQIKAGFSMPAIPKGIGAAGKGGLGAIAGLSLLSMLPDSANAGENQGPGGQVAPTGQPEADFDILDSTKAVQAVGNSRLTGGAIRTTGNILTSKPVTKLAEQTGDVLRRATNSAMGLGVDGKPVTTTNNAVKSLLRRTNQVADIASKADKLNIGPIIAKIVTKKGPGLVSRAIPMLGTVVGGVLGVKKLIEGDMVGAGLAATALVPGVGTVGTLGVAGYEIAREAYNEVHGQYPEGDPKVKERMPELLEEATNQVTEFVETELKARATQRQNLVSAVDSGLFDKDIIGNSEVNADMISDATTGQLQAIIKDDDISDEDKALITSELESRSNVTPLTSQPMIDSAPLQETTEEVEALQQQSQEPVIINTPQNNTGGTAPTPDVHVAVNLGDPLAPDSAGSARFISRD